MNPHDRHRAFHDVQALIDRARAQSPAVDGEVLIRFDRGGREEVRVTLKDFEGRRFIDVRRWFLDQAGQWRPTTKGASIRLGEVDRLVEALERVSNGADGG